MPHSRRWVAILAFILLTPGLLIVGIAQFGHRFLGVGYTRTVRHDYVVADEIEVDEAAAEQGLSPSIDVSWKCHHPEMGLLLETRAYGNPYGFEFNMLSTRENARLLRVESGELRFADGSGMVLEFVPRSPRDEDGAALFSENHGEPHQARASFFAGRHEIPAYSTLQLRIEYTVEMSDGTRVRGVTEATLEYRCDEDVGFKIPSV